MFASQTRDLSHIELMFAKRTAIYRVRAQREHIESTKLTYRQKEKTRARIEGFSPFTLALSVRNRGMGFARSVCITNAKPAIKQNDNP